MAKKIVQSVSSEETTSQQLFSHLFEACNILRGPINQDEYRSYVTPILFFKRISDVYDEETQIALEESGGDEEYAAFPENHSFDIPPGCHWNDVREAHENIGVAIVKAMTGIERANPDTLSGVFSSFDDANWTDKGKLSDERLKNLVEHMSKIKLGNQNYSDDIMGDSNEYLIKKFADLSKKNAGEFYTPRPIVKLMVQLLAPKAGDYVYDGACGTGGMLLEAIRYIGNDQLTYGKIFGQEKNLATSAIARMNLFLHGAKDVQIVQGDTLRSPAFEEEAITISARGAVGYSAIRRPFFTPVVRLLTVVPKTCVDIIFLKHCIDASTLVGTGSSQGQLTLPEFKKLFVLVPPLDLQKQFAAFVRQTDKSKYNGYRTIIGLIDLISFISNERSISQ